MSFARAQQSSPPSPSPSQQGPTPLAPSQLQTPRAPGDQALITAAQELARKATAALGGLAEKRALVRAGGKSLSSLSLEKQDEAFRAFEEGIKSQGLTLAARAPAAGANVPAITFVVSENTTDFLLIASLPGGAGQGNAVIVPIPRSSLAGTAHPRLPVTLEKQFLVSLPHPILDFEFLPGPQGAPSSLLVLQPKRIAVFAQVAGHWQIESQAQLPEDPPWPRDLRGRVEQTATGPKAFLPGAVCDISSVGSLAIACAKDDEPWAVAMGFSSATRLRAHFVAQRNYLLFAIQGQPQPFYSLAQIASSPARAKPPGSLALLGTTPEGRALLFDGGGAPLASFSGWGSDFAVLGVEDPGPWPVLVTGDGDWTEPDTIQAFLVQDQQPVAISGVVHFDGPVTALWPSRDGAARVVSKNLMSGRYEAFLLHATYQR